MIRLPAALALTIAFALPASAATDDELRTVLIGTWGDQADCTTGILVFNSNGSFSSLNGSDPTDRQEGTYQIKDGHLTGKTPEHDMPDIVLVYDGTDLYFQNEGGTKEQLFPCTK